MHGEIIQSLVIINSLQKLKLLTKKENYSLSDLCYGETHVTVRFVCLKKKKIYGRWVGPKRLVQFTYHTMEFITIFKESMDFCNGASTLM